MSRQYVCEKCGCKMHDGESLFRWMFGNAEEGLVCEDCFDALVRDMTRTELAERMGCEEITVDDWSIPMRGYYG